MVKLINGAYFLLSAMGFYIAMQLLWSWRTHRTMSLRPILSFLALFGLLYLIGLWNDYISFDSISTERTTRAQSLSGAIRVAAVWPKDEPVFFEAARQAVREINDADGVLLRDDNQDEVAHKVELAEYPSESEGDTIFRSVARDPDLMAVIGHRDTDDAIHASITYNEAGLLYMVPTVTTPALTAHSFQRLIRTVPDDSLLAARMAKFLRDKGLKRVAILHARTNHGETLTRYVGRALLEQMMHGEEDRMPKVSLIRSYAPGIKNFDELITEIIEDSPDAVVIADNVPRSAALIRRIRERGINLPLVGIPNLESQRFFKYAGRLSDDVYIVSLFDEAKTRPLADKEGSPWRFAAGQAYETMHILAEAWRKAGTVDPATTAATLRAIPTWEGQYGVYDFRPNGDMHGRSLHIKRSQGGRFVPLNDSSAALPTTEG